MTDPIELRALLAEAIERDYLGTWVPEEWERRALETLEKVGWHLSNLRETGTVAFDMDVMLQLIRLNPDQYEQLIIGEWLLVVPDLFRDMAAKQAQKLFDEERVGRPFDGHQRRQFIMQLSHICVNKAEQLKKKS